jgi:Transposase IS116/IS110/IS902 family
LAARVLAEFGDDPQRYISAKARKAYAGTAPITRASGLRQVVLARSIGNRRLSTACHLWAFAALTGSAGARRYYDACPGSSADVVSGTGSYVGSRASESHSRAPPPSAGLSRSFRR